MGGVPITLVDANLADLGTSTNPINTTQTTSDKIAFGDVPGYSFINKMGERESMGTIATGEDIWRGTATSIPKPADAGEQMTLVSSDAEDNASGDGARAVTIEYLDATGAQQTTTVIPDGTTPVNLTPSDVRYINDIYSSSLGDTGVAEGDITVYKTGAATTIYNMIAAGGNKSLVPHFMVPLGHEVLLVNWHTEEAQGRRVNVRIRADCTPDGIRQAGVFLFKDTVYINKSATGSLPLCSLVPALSIIKVSGWPDGAGGAEVGCGWTGKMRLIS